MNWTVYEKKPFTGKDLAVSDIRGALIGEMIAARKKRGFTQKQLEAMTGIRQSMIARLETGTTDPQISTLLKLLAPLGKTLAIVPLPPKED